MFIQEDMTSRNVLSVLLRVCDKAAGIIQDITYKSECFEFVTRQQGCRDSRTVLPATFFPQEVIILKGILRVCKMAKAKLALLTDSEYFSSSYTWQMSEKLDGREDHAGESIRQCLGYQAMPNPSNMSINETTRRLQHLSLIHNFQQKHDTAPLFHIPLATSILEQGILLFQCLRRKSSGQPGPVGGRAVSF